jgi:hypothetical protein
MTDENDAILISNRFLSFMVLSISFIYFIFANASVSHCACP